MAQDPIIDELRRVRRKTEAACGHDWDKLVAHYRQVQERTKQKVVAGAPKRLAPPRKSA